MKDKCTLTDAELIASIRNWAGKLAESGGKAWCLQVPVNFNHDPDMLMQEIATRLEGRSDLSPDKEREVAVLEAAAAVIDMLLEDSPYNRHRARRSEPYQKYRELFTEYLKSKQHG